MRWQLGATLNSVIISTVSEDCRWEECAKMAVYAADALIAELEK